MAPRRRRVLQVRSDDSSSSEGRPADDTRLAEAEGAAQEDDDVIEVIESPLDRSSSDGATRENFSAVSNVDPLSPETSHLVQPFSTSTVSFPFSAASQYAALEAFLRSRGVRPTSQWLDACVESLAASRAGFLQLPVSQQAESCFSRFALSDLNTMGAAMLPPQLHTLHGVELDGPFVLQVDEISDIGSAIRHRYKERPASAGRCLKLSLTDGIQRVFGIEYRPIRDLDVLSPAGFKLAVHHVNIRRGLLLLVPEIVKVLGGQVDYFEAARQRVVQHVNKPPRCARSMRGTTPQSLVESACTAAWAVDKTREVTRLDEQHTWRPEEPSRASASGPPNLVADMRASANEGVAVPNGEEQTSVTYLSLLKKKWASSQGASDIQGRIKCVLTGVKEFHFKNLEQFRLLVYVDDGSEISSVLIHHHVVQRFIGYSPGEVSAALASPSSNEAIRMKENLNRFQVFLTKFEGILLLWMNDATLPVATEMTEGCPKHEAWLLAERLQGASEDESKRNTGGPIALSP